MFKFFLKLFQVPAFCAYCGKYLGFHWRWNRWSRKHIDRHKHCPANPGAINVDRSN